MSSNKLSPSSPALSSRPPHHSQSSLHLEIKPVKPHEIPSPPLGNRERALTSNVSRGAGIRIPAAVVFINSSELLIFPSHQGVSSAQLLPQLAVSQFQSVDGFPLLDHLLRDLYLLLLQLLLEVCQVL